MQKMFSNSVVILCGGEGTRMKEETEFKPKPLVLVGGKPIIWHIMKIYSHYGYNHFVLTLGYKGSMIKEYFLNARAYNNNFTLNTRTGDINYVDDDHDDFVISFVETGAESGTGERIRRAAPYIQGDYFHITYGDGVSDINIASLVKFHLQKKPTITITGVHPTSKYGLVDVSRDMIATGFQQKPILHDFVSGGFMVAQKKLLNQIVPGSMIEDDIIRLAKRRRVAVYEHKGFWQAMDTYKEMADLNKIWAKKHPWKVWK